MKFDPLSWQEIKVGTKYETEKGRVHVKATTPLSLFVSIEGVEALVETGTDLRVELAQEMEYWLEGPAKTRCFVHAPGKLYYKPVGEVFTNADRLPDESGAMQEVRKALRAMKLENREILRNMRENMKTKSGDPKKVTAEQKDPPGDPEKADEKPEPSEVKEDDKPDDKKKS